MDKASPTPGAPEPRPEIIVMARTVDILVASGLRLSALKALTPRSQKSDSSEAMIEPSLSVEAGAFWRELPALLERAEGRLAVYIGEERLGIYDTLAEAIDAGHERTRFTRPFLVKCIEVDHHAEPSTWEMGRTYES